MRRPTEFTVEELLADLSDLGERWKTLAKAHPGEQLMRRPEPGKWCIAECAEHVALGNAAYLAKILPVVPGLPAASNSQKIRIRGLLSGLLYRMISPGAPRKLKAPGTIRPLAADPVRSFTDLERTHDQIRSLLTLEPPRDFNHTRFQNPFVPLLRFTVGSGILIMAAHGRRHLEQAERIGKSS